MYSAGQPEPGPAAAAPTLAEAAVHVNAVFAELGFDPELASDGEGLQISLSARSFAASPRHTRRWSARST
jgi:hypothetical protein